MIKSLSKILLGLVLVLPVAAMADNSHSNTNSGGSFSAGIGGQLTTYTGNVDSTSSSHTIGGSGSSTFVSGTGSSLQSSANAGGGTSFAGGSVNAAGVKTVTDVTSYATGVSVGHVTGNAAAFDNEGFHTNYTSSGVGTDVNANSEGAFTSVTFGGNIQIGGYNEVSGYQNHTNHGNHYGNGNHGE